ncbi:HAD-IC family P-type ATPase [Candidatus Saccharibacteria bacterium]|nr:HAD-IC family P-type ATPase [Candidatus Saccharibacteria bacterium]
MNLTGLSSAQVAAKIEQGRVNKVSRKKTNSVSKIIIRNTLTIFNIVNLILALMIISVGSYKNLLFIFIAIANTLISIINEIRAKRTIDKMRLIAEQKPTVIRDGKTIQIPPTEIVDGDLLILSLGDQVIVDAKVEEGQVEVNESFITGESDNILKHPGDKLISGSFIVSGTCKASVVAVGSENFISKLESSAHTIKTADSKLFTIMNNIVKYISFALIPIGALLLWARFRVPDSTPEVAITSTVAALINMIPEGLILLTSSVLALATIRLSRQKVLVQDLYSIETLARVDCICLDKTGTLTTGKMTVKDLIPAKGQSKNALEAAFTAILSHSTADNATSAALKQKLLKTAKNREINDNVEIIPFSSDRKYSGIKTPKSELLMGALEFMTKNPEYLKQEKSLEGDYRIISVIKKTPEKETLLGFALLEDELRKDASDIIKFFIDNNVDIKVISGDNLSTVQSIATKVGIPNPTPVDLSTLDTPINYEKLVETYNIFTRVKPAQKKSLVLALKKQGKTVAMTGDGVNDILAMKEADCSIAIGEGSDAARRSAKLVLLNSDFAAVPSVIAEGRQSINNLERSTTLFLSKTVYASILAVFFVILPLEYPFSPIEMSLLNFACIGFPGLVLALEKNTERIKNNFTKNILQYSVPIGLTVSIVMLVLATVAELKGFSRPELTTISVFVTFSIDLVLIYWISRPLNPLRTTLLASIIGIIAIAFSVPTLRRLLDFTFLSLDGIIVTIAAISAGLIIFNFLRLIARRISGKIFS